jgi:primosomal protein N''
LPLVPSPQAAARKAAEDTEARLLKLLEKQTEYTTTIAALEAERDKLAQDLAAMTQRKVGCTGSVVMPCAVAW